MGLLDFIFSALTGSGRNGDKKMVSQGDLFNTSEEIRKELFKVKSLDASQRKLTRGVISKYLSGSGVTRGEFKTYLLPEFRKLKKEGKLSEIDYKNLKKFLRT